jgi:hypothetical protein
MIDSCVVGVDVEGTFIDCAVVADAGTMSLGKALSRLPNFAEGVVAAGRDADKLGMARLEDLLERIDWLSGAYLDQVPTKDLPFITDHLFSPADTSVKQFCGEFFQVVQKPSLLSFQVPSPFTPALPSGSRVILPSAEKTILYSMFCGVAEVKGCPVKNVD